MDFEKNGGAGDWNGAMVSIEERSLIPFGVMAGVEVVIRVRLTLGSTDKTMVNHLYAFGAIVVLKMVPWMN